MCGPATNIDVPPLPKRGPYSISEARYSGVVRHPEDLAEGSGDVRGWMLYALLLPADRVKTRVFARVWAGTEGGRYAYEESTTSMARAIGCSSPSVRQALAEPRHAGVGGEPNRPSRLLDLPRVAARHPVAGHRKA